VPTPMLHVSRCSNRPVAIGQQLSFLE